MFFSTLLVALVLAGVSQAAPAPANTSIPLHANTSTPLPANTSTPLSVNSSIPLPVHSTTLSNNATNIFSGNISTNVAPKDVPAAIPDPSTTPKADANNTITPGNNSNSSRLTMNTDFENRNLDPSQPISDMSTSHRR